MQSPKLISDIYNFRTHFKSSMKNISSFSQLEFPYGLKKYDLPSLQMIDIIYTGVTSTIISASLGELTHPIVLKAFLGIWRWDQGRRSFCDFLNELQILIHLGCINTILPNPNCPYLLSVYGYGVLNSQPALVMESLKGSMTDVLQLKSERLTKSNSFSDTDISLESLQLLNKIPPDKKLCQWLLWSRQMSDSIEYIHSKDIVHCAIKPNHFMFHGLFMSDFVVLTNFTHAQKLKCNSSDDILSNDSSVMSITPPIYESTHHMAPELHTNNFIITEKIDIWALSLILLQLYSGDDSILFEPTHNSDLKKPSLPNSLCDALLDDFQHWVFFIVQKFQLPLFYIQNCSQLQLLIKQTIFSLISDGLKFDPQSRPTASQISKTFKFLLEAVKDFLDDLNINLNNKFESKKNINQKICS